MKYKDEIEITLNKISIHIYIYEFMLFIKNT